MARCLEIILLAVLVRAVDLEAKIVQADQVSQFVNKNVWTKNIFSLKRRSNSSKIKWNYVSKCKAQKTEWVTVQFSAALLCQKVLFMRAQFRLYL